MNDPCEKIQDTITDYILGALNQQEIDVLQEHLSWCSQCRKRTQGLLDLSRSLGRLAKQLEADMTAREDSVIKVLNRSSLTKQIRPAFIWSTIIRSRVARIAAVAVVIVTVLIGVSVFTGPQEGPIRDVVKRTTTHEADEAKIKLDARLAAEAEKIRQMAGGGDIEGLIAMLSDGLYGSKISATYYLGKIGDMRAIPALLALSEQWQGDELEDPFAAAIEEILGRLAVEQSSSEAGPNIVEAEPNIVTEKTDAVAKTQRVFSLLVINEQTKEPIPDVELNINLDGDKGRDVTDPQGHCVINLPEKEFGYLSIEAREDGFVPVVFSYDRKEAPVPLPENYTLLLERGVPIGGFIQNEQGEPIEGASVRLRPLGPVATKPPTGIGQINPLHLVQDEKTDANGFWRCDNMPDEVSEFRMSIYHSGYIYERIYGTQQEPSIEELRNMTSAMVMAKGFDVDGYVLDMDGQPVKGARVRKGLDRFLADYLKNETHTDEQGKFRFISARGGKMVLTVKAEGFAPALKQIMVHKDTPSVEFRLEPGGTIRGQIGNSESKPIEGASVTANRWRGYRSIDWQSKTGPDGYFEWNNAPEDEVLFNITKAGYMSICDLPIVCDGNEYTIEMYRPLRISGKVVDTESDKPIEKFKLIYMVDWGSTPPFCPLCGEPDCQERPSFYPFTFGRYELSFDHPADQYRFRIEADGYIPAISRAFTSDEGNVAFDFELQKGTGPSGTVYLPDGQPAAEAQVILCTPSQGASIRNGRIAEEIHTQFTKTGTDGRFSFPPQAETYLLAVLAEQDYAEVTAEQLQTDSNITIEPWGRVEGTLYIGSRPAANQEVFLYYTNTNEPNAPQIDYEDAIITDANGFFAFDSVPPRRVRVGRLLRLSSRVTNPSHAVVVNVESGQTVNIAVGGIGTRVTGKVTVPADYKAPVNFSCAYNSICPKSSESQAGGDTDLTSYAFKINSDGTFHIKDIPAGTYTLQISLHERLLNRDGSRGECIGQVNYDLVIPESDEPLDIGTLELEME